VNKIPVKNLKREKIKIDKLNYCLSDIHLFTLKSLFISNFIFFIPPYFLHPSLLTTFHPLFTPSYPSPLSPPSPTPPLPFPYSLLPPFPYSPLPPVRHIPPYPLHPFPLSSGVKGEAHEWCES